MTANKRQVAGTHYASDLQHWDWVQLLNLHYLPAAISKYLVRWRKKGGVQDLEKAAHYLEKFIEEERSRHETARDLTSAFIHKNGIPHSEAVIIRCLVNHHAEGVGCLLAAQALIQKLIEQEKNPPQS